MWSTPTSRCFFGVREEAAAPAADPTLLCFAAMRFLPMKINLRLGLGQVTGNNSYIFRSCYCYQFVLFLLHLPPASAHRFSDITPSSSGVCLGTLAADRQSSGVPHSSVTFNILQ